MKRRTVYESIFSAKALFFTGLLIMPALLFNPSTELRILQFLFFWLLLWLSGKKTNPLITLLIITVIVVFNLIIPYGQVLYSFGSFKITSGALKAGIHRAVTLQALVVLSKVSVRQDLKVPGAFGELLSESLRLFSIMMSRKYRFKENGFITEIDNMLLELSVENPDDYVVKESVRTKHAGFIVLFLVIVFSWVLTSFTFLNFKFL